MPYSLVLPNNMAVNSNRRPFLISAESIFRMAKALGEIVTLAAVTLGTLIFFTGLNFIIRTM